LGEAKALRSLGHHKLVLEVLADAGDVADRASNPRRQAEVKIERGAAMIFSRQADLSGGFAARRLKVARAEKDDALAAEALDGVALVLSAQDEVFRRDCRVGRSRRPGKTSQVARDGGARAKNKADAALAAKAFGDARQWAEESAKEAANFAGRTRERPLL
jgi:hypothetical protein